MCLIDERSFKRMQDTAQQRQGNMQSVASLKEEGRDDMLRQAGMAMYLCNS